MIFPKDYLALAVLVFGASISPASGECVSPGSLTCSPTEKPPVIDGGLTEWSGVRGIETPLTGALGATPYQPGNVRIKCVYDDTHIYFALEVPGTYRFDSEDDHKCAAIATMFKIGRDATYINMGGCPHAMDGCAADPGACDDYKVDIGGHWELKTTEMGVAYAIDVTSGTGDDPVANKDDEYAVSAFCRLDDDGSNAGNEWAAAWSHTLPSAPEVTPKTFDGVTFSTMGTYIFEMSRLLRTKSPDTDVQLEAGKTYSFGAAYWDPNEIEETGWTDHGHFVTGCSRDWIDLILDEDTAKRLNSRASTTKNAALVTALLFAFSFALI